MASKTRQQITISLFRTAGQADFVRRHGNSNRTALEMLVELSKTDAKKNPEIFEAWQKRLNSYPLMAATLQISQALHKVSRRPEVAARADAVELCDLLALVVGMVSESHGDAVEAFAELFFGAQMRLDNRRRALEAHAPKKAVLAEAWEHFKKAKYSSLAEGARACAQHYRGDGMPTQRAFLDHFRAKAKAEKLTFKPGRKAAEKPKKKPA